MLNPEERNRARKKAMRLLEHMDRTEKAITPEYCVRCALDGIARRKTVIVPSPLVAAGMTLGRFLPRPVYIKIAAHQQRKKLYKR